VKTHKDLGPRLASGSRWARRLALLAVLGSFGCLSKPAMVRQSFSIDPPSERNANPSAGARIVSLGTVEVAPVYEGSSFVYRVGKYGIERDTYAGFAASPGQMLTAAIAGYLADSGLVKDVVFPGGGPADASISVYVSDLYGDLRSADEAFGVLSLRFRVESAGAPGGAREILDRSYTQRIRLPERTPAALAAAWNEALAAIMKAFLADLKPALK
jgi:uncharacterized lipoprotein YmbA